MPQFLTDLQDRRTLKNLDNLSLIECSLSEEIKKEIEELNGRVEISSKNVGDIVKSIESKEKSLRKVDDGIKTTKKEMKELKDKLGVKRFINREYRKLKKYVKTLKKIKKEHVNAMSQLYARLQEEKRKLKDARIKQKSLYKMTQELAKEHKKEIKFAKKLDLGKVKLENRDAAQKILEEIKQNNGKLPDNLQDENGISIVGANLKDILKGDRTVKDIKKMEEQEEEQEADKGNENTTDEASEVRNESEEPQLDVDKDNKIEKEPEKEEPKEETEKETEPEKEETEEVDFADYYGTGNGNIEQKEKPLNEENKKEVEEISNKEKMEQFLLEHPYATVMDINSEFGTSYSQKDIQEGIEKDFDGINYKGFKETYQATKETCRKILENGSEADKAKLKEELEMLKNAKKLKEKGRITLAAMESELKGQEQDEPDNSSDYYDMGYAKDEDEEK